MLGAEPSKSISTSPNWTVHCAAANGVTWRRLSTSISCCSDEGKCASIAARSRDMGNANGVMRSPRAGDLSMQRDVETCSEGG